MDYLGKRHVKSFYCNPVNPEEVKNIIAALRNSNANGLDGVPIKILKVSKDINSAPLSPIINLSLKVASHVKRV